MRPPTRAAPENPSPRPIGMGDRTQSAPVPPDRREKLIVEASHFLWIEVGWTGSIIGVCEVVFKWIFTCLIIDGLVGINPVNWQPPTLQLQSQPNLEICIGRMNVVLKTKMSRTSN